MADETVAAQKFVVGVRTLQNNLVKAFDISIKGYDIYVNYSDCFTPEAHCSYHASGQYHIKVGRQWVQWDGGPTGNMEPMKLFRERPGLVCGRCVCWTVGWVIGRLEEILPALNGKADMVVTASDVDPALILGFEVGVIGDDAKPQKSIVGYPVIASRQFGNGLRAEVNAFLLTDQQNGAFDL